TGASAALLTETNSALNTSGQLFASDVDSSAAFMAQSGIVGSNGYGAFSINAAGLWTYTMNGAHDEFVDGQTYTDSAMVKTADGTPQVITVNILGTNDAAVITGSSTAVLTQSDVAQSTGGSLFADDIDGVSTFVAQSG